MPPTAATPPAISTVSVSGGAGYGTDVPFGGMKQSGIGRKTGVAGFEEHLETRPMAEGI